MAQKSDLGTGVPPIKLSLAGLVKKACAFLAYSWFRSSLVRISRLTLPPRNINLNWKKSRSPTFLSIQQIEKYVSTAQSVLIKIVLPPVYVHLLLFGSS